jgi:hypothetical protein
MPPPMAHPFFEANQFPMQREDGRALFKLLTAIFTKPGDITLMVQTAGGDPADLSQGLTPRQLWGEALNLLAAARVLDAFCDQLKQNPRVKTNPEVQAAVEAVVNAKPLVDRQIVSDKRLVLDRAALRTKLRALGADDSPLRVVLVRGGDDSGKSWGRHVFLNAAEDSGAVGVYLSANQIVNIDSLTSKLFAAFEATDVPPRGLTTGVAWYDAVCSKLSVLAASRNQHLWAAIDDIALIDPEICEFCDQFVAMMENPAFSRWFRLMLIHYPDDRSPTRWQEEVWDEDITSEADLTYDEVVSFFKTWADDCGYKILDSQIDELAHAAINTADTVPTPQQGKPPPPRLKRLHDHLVSTLAEQTQALGNGSSR